MNYPFDLSEEEKLFLDHLAYETIQHRPNCVYRWCREHGIEPYELAPLGAIHAYEYTVEPPKGLCPKPWASRSQFRERAEAAADFLRATGKWAISLTPMDPQPMTRPEREFYDLWLGELFVTYVGRASYLLAKRGIYYNHMTLLWGSYQAAWDAIGHAWCHHVPPLPLDLDLPCPWDSVEGLASRARELVGLSPVAVRGLDSVVLPVPRTGGSTHN